MSPLIVVSSMCQMLFLAVLCVYEIPLLSSNPSPLYKSSQFPCHLHKYLIQHKAGRKASPHRSLTVSDGYGLPIFNANDPSARVVS